MESGIKPTVFLTGATGFIGGHILRELTKAGYEVRSLVRSGSSLPESYPSVTTVSGDVRQAGFLVDHLRGCRYLVHAAALYSFSPRHREAVWETNVRGTRSILEAARLAGVERAVVTSSSATVGPAIGGRSSTEMQWQQITWGDHSYHASKVQQEREALAAQIPTVLLLPTAPVGPGDHRPTPTGRMIVDFMRGRIFGSLKGGLNLVPVEAVAKAHVTALERGLPGERYLLGGQNFKLSELWRLLALICKRPAPRIQVPYSLALALARLDDLRCRFISGGEPSIPVEGVKMATEDMFAISRKAEEELDYHPGPVVQALTQAVDWFRFNGYAA